VKAAEVVLAVVTGLCGLISTVRGLKRRDWDMVWSGAGLVLCATWLLLRTL
jgi:hypothetical protein